MQKKNLKIEMNISIVIPAHNEAAFLTGCLESICLQTLSPQQLIVVSDNSSDNTYKIAQEFAKKHPFITAINHSSSNIHMPGSKVVQAFNFGLKQLDKDYDILLKLDADILLPKNYLETISARFSSQSFTRHLWRICLRTRPQRTMAFKPPYG